jgi:ribosomal protein L7/L12
MMVNNKDWDMFDLIDRNIMIEIIRSILPLNTQVVARHIVRVCKKEINNSNSNFNPHRLDMIRITRTITGCSLIEAKEAVEVALTEYRGKNC